MAHAVEYKDGKFEIEGLQKTVTEMGVHVVKLKRLARTIQQINEHTWNLSLANVLQKIKTSLAWLIGRYDETRENIKKGYMTEAFELSQTVDVLAASAPITKTTLDTLLVQITKALAMFEGQRTKLVQLHAQGTAALNQAVEAEPKETIGVQEIEGM